MGGGQMEWGRRACHRQRITPIPHSLWPTLAGHFPNLAPTFYAASPHNFLPGSTKLHMLSCNSTYFPTAHLPGGDKADRFTKQLLSEFSG